MPRARPQPSDAPPAPSPWRVEGVLRPQPSDVLGAGEPWRVEGADRRVAALAARQHGVVHFDQLLAAGLSRSAIKHRVGRGWLHRIHRGVYAVGHAALTVDGRCAAALLACGEDAALSHWSAAGRYVLAEPPVLVHVTVPAERRPIHDGIVVHRSRVLSPADVRVVRGLPTTSPARTIDDLSWTAPRTRLERIVAEAQAQRLVTAAELRDGAPRVRALLDDGPGVTRSEAERLLLRLVRRAGLPAPATNVRVAGLEVDALWRAQRVVVEVDGYAFHGHRQAFEHDRRRDRVLRGAGLVPVRTTWRQLRDEPEAVVADLAAALARGV